MLLLLLQLLSTAAKPPAGGLSCHPQQFCVGCATNQSSALKAKAYVNVIVDFTGFLDISNEQASEVRQHLTAFHSEDSSPRHLSRCIAM